MVSRRKQTRMLAFISILSALAVVGRIYFNFIPNFQPVTAIIIIASMFLGIRNAVMLTIVSTIASNLVLGMGIWTIWQILCWSLIGVIFGFLGKFHLPIFIYAILAGLSGFVYGFFISIPYYIVSGNYWAYYLAGLPFDVNHAVGNVLFFAVLYPVLKKIVDRSKLVHIA